MKKEISDKVVGHSATCISRAVVIGQFIFFNLRVFEIMNKISKTVTFYVRRTIFCSVKPVISFVHADYPTFALPTLNV